MNIPDDTRALIVRQLGAALANAWTKQMSQQDTVHWWHYTVGLRLFGIVKDGRLKRADIGVDRSERRAVWFTSRPTWEPTATSMILDKGATEPRKATLPELAEKGAALIRIEVPADVARYDWAHHRKLGGVDPRIADALERVARADGSDPSEWRVSYRDVPLSAFIAIDESADGVHWRCVSSRNEDGEFCIDGDLVARCQDVYRKGGRA